MSIPVVLRGDFKASQLRALARKTKDGPQARRLLTLAAIYDGATRTEAARIGDVTLQIIRDWVMRFNARGAAGLLDGKSPGQPSRLNDVQRQAMVRMIESGPIPGDPRCSALAADRSFAMDIRGVPYHGRQTDAEPGTSRDGLPQALSTTAIMRKPREQSRILKKLPARLDGVAREKAIDVGKIEIWFQDEARIGQKNKITRRWAKRGTRPSAPRDQRTASTYIFGAICPKQGKGAALILPFCNTEAMNLHLAEIAKAIAPGAHAVLLVDQAGWHLSAGLFIPANITIIPLPPKCPELNPVENIWQYMRDNWLSNRIFKSYDDIVDHCCYAWNTLVDRPWKIMSIGLRQWAHGF